MIRFLPLFIAFILSSSSIFAQFNASKDFVLPQKEASKRNNVREFFIDEVSSLEADRRGIVVYSSFVEKNSENIYSAYANNEEYILHIKSAYADDRLSLRLDYLVTEQNKDFLTIYDGSSVNSQIIDHLSGMLETSKLFLSSGNELTVKFKSDAKNNYLGFKFFVVSSNFSGDVERAAASMACTNSTPAADFCSNAPLICNLNGYCGNTSGQYTSTQSQPPNFCGSIENNSWLSFIASGATASFTFNSSNCADNSSGIQASIYSSSDCNSFTSVANCESQGSAPGSFTITTNVALVSGQLYYIMVDGFGGNVCDYTVTAQSGVATTPQIIASSTTVCPGYSATLTSSVQSATYTWSSSAGGTFPNTQTITVTPAATTTYTLDVGANACGANGTATQTITVSNTLPPPNITAPSTVCQGDQLTLTTTNSGVSYQWSGPAGFSSTVQSPTVPNFSAANNGTYQLIISQGPGCSSTPASININVIASPNVTLTANPTSVCSGSTTTLTAGGGGSNSAYTWNWNLLQTSVTTQICVTIPFVGTQCNNNPISFIPGQSGQGPSATATPTASTQICVSATGSNGCIGDACVNITVASSTPVTAAGTTTICAGQTANLTSSIAGNWTSSPAGFTATNSASVNVTPAVTTTYTVSAPACGGSNTTASVTVTVTSPTVTVSPQLQTTCPGSPVTITSSAAGNWTSIPAGFTATNTNTITVSPSANTQYIVTSGAGACTDTAIATVNMGTFNVTVSPQLQTICSGGSATITASSAGNWTSLPAGFTATNTNTITVSPASNTAYIITAGTGVCTDTAIAAVSVANFNVTVSPQLQSVCSGVNAAVTSSVAGNWTSVPAGFTASNVNSISVSPTASTQYIVTATSSGCTDTAIAKVNIIPPAFTLTPSAAQTSCVGNTGSASVVVNPAGAYTYAWVNAGNVSVGSASTANNLPAGTYTVTVSQNGCTKDTTATVTVPSNPVMILAGLPLICAGDTSGVVASGVDSITVSPLTGVLGILDTIAVIKPASTTTYTVTGYNTITKCSVQQTFTITVNAKPAITSLIVQAATCGQADGSITLTAGGTNTYSWNSSPVQNTANLSNVLAGNYTVTITGNPSGCVLDSVINVPSGGAVTLSVPTGIEKCPNDTVVLSLAASNGSIPNAVYTYNPTTGVTNLSANGDSVLLTPSTTTTYTVTVTSNGCTDSKAMTVTVNPLPDITLNGTNASCGKNNGAIASVINNGTGPFAYQWISAANPNFSNASSVSGLSAGTYGLLVVDSKSCWDTSTISITNTPPVIVTVSGNDTSLCAGDLCVLTAAGANTYSWTPSAGLSAATGSSVIATPAVTTLYSVIGSDAANVCKDTAKITVVMNPTPNIFISPSSPVICEDSLLTLNIVGANNYAWTPTASLPFISANGNQVIANPIVTTLYTVYGTSTAGCIDTAVVNVVVIPKPNANAGNDVFICPGTSVTLSGSGGSVYTWSPATYLSNATGAITTSTPLGNFIYVLTASNGACYSKDTVGVYIYPEVSISAYSDTTINIGESHAINVYGGNEPYEWTPSGSLSCATCSTTVATPTETTEYIVSFTDTNGCVAIDTVLIKVTHEYALYTPNAFTVDGDNRNDKFVVFGFGIKEYTLKVFDRWGVLVHNQKYSTADLNTTGWDGKYKGTQVSSDVYVWTVEYTTTGNINGKRVGSVTLLK